ncbi:hypothetical protein H072_2303 [Dactylellina haptotyla CBS 200.50]|uniref:Histidine kinase n=1 Tax=Dactylellina haptotyla (strain CBS 200.50) TaxID=1284197 RepID=S8ALA5_DACHA|nr:hypothetical protein H072_2303 [Dactylellina haptotyla CBS 200.50]
MDAAGQLGRGRGSGNNSIGGSNGGGGGVGGSRNPSYSSATTSASTRKSSSNDFNTIVTAQITHEQHASRTRKLSVVSFTSAEYNRNDEDEWEEDATDERGQRGQQQGIVEEESDLPSSLSSGYSSSSGSSTSSDGGYDDNETDSNTLSNQSGSLVRSGASGRTIRTDRDQRRRKLLRNQRRNASSKQPPPQHRHQQPSSLLPAFCSDSQEARTDTESRSRTNDGNAANWVPVSSCYGGGGIATAAAGACVSSLNSSTFSRPKRSSPPSLFGVSSPKRHDAPRNNAVTVRTSSSRLQESLPLASSSSSTSSSGPHSWHNPATTAATTTTTTPSSSLTADPNRNVDTPAGFHRHSLSSSSLALHSHNHDHHLHKRRRRHDSDLPEIGFLTPPPIPTSAPRKAYSHQHSLSATSTTELLSSASLHTPPGRDTYTSDSQHIIQPAPIRPAVLLKGRSLSTPAGGVDDLFTPLRSLNTSPSRANRLPDSIRDLWNRQVFEGCQVYDMVVAPSSNTFTVPVTKGSPPTIAPPTISPEVLKSLAVPIRDSQPEGLHRVQLLEVLANDPRPTFILGTISTTTTEESRQSSTTIHDLQLEVVYHNDAFSSLLPDAAFSTTTVESGVDRTTFNITDPQYHRWISSSFANTSTRNGKCRPYVCPDGILWTQNAFTCADGARMVLICGVPLPSTQTKHVHISKGETCPPHLWENAMEAAKARDNPDQDQDQFPGEPVSEYSSLPVLDPGTPSIGVMGQTTNICQTPGCVSIGQLDKDDGKSESVVPESSRFGPIKVPNYYIQVAKEMDSDMVISPTSTPAPESPPKRRSPVSRTEDHVTEEMDISDDMVIVNPDSVISTVYSPHMPSEYGFFDWTRLPLSVPSDDHIELVRKINWAATGFGAIEMWPQSLRTMINLVLSSPHPAAMYWGPDFSIVYNEAYIPLIGAKHPSLLGQRYKDGWSEIWEAIEPFFQEAIQTGTPTNKEDDRLFILRNGFREETYFSWSICPIIGEDGTTIGLHNPAFEKTRRVIAERRMLTLREVGERCGSARDVKSFWRYLLAALETNPWDAPFAILYSCKKPDSTESEVSSAYASSLSTTKLYSLEGTIGVPDDHPAAPAMMDLRSNADGFSVAFREALQVEGNIFLSQESGTFPTDLMNGIEFQGFSEDQCTSAVVCPINPNSDTPLGFLVLGINPRRPFDEDYRLFIQLLTRQVTTSIASVVLYEEEIRRAQRAARLAALDRVELSHQLALKSKEAEHSELKFTRMAEFAPVGIFIADFQGKINYYNDTFSEISCHPTELDPSRWLESVHPADLAKTEANWVEVINGKRRKTWEFRWKVSWTLPNHLGEQVDRWTLLSASPELDADGMLLGVFGSITNISETKFAEDLQKRRVEEVVELKRQQDNFVDMASHEMRNPLSAILQGADAILGSLERYRQIASSPDLLDDIESSIDVAQTISLCALHQKRVVDDILTMSKLDSALLTVTPVDVQPIAVVEKAFKIFEQEAISSETKMTFKIDDSYKNLAIDWVKLDPARLLQVLINLLTNALKFLRTEPSKSIIVTMGGSAKRPSPAKNNSLFYFPSTRKAVDLTTGSDWGTGDAVFLTFSVLDTGKGLTEIEKKNLFQKFSQATAKTEVSYGGSGLGLFICKELVHLQSGEIGVQSEAGKGCVFSFYVKARRSARPDVEIPQAPVLPGSAKRRDVNGFTPAGKPGAKPVKLADEKPKLNYNVLIVEDNLVNQKLLRKALEVAGCTTYVANHGMEALERIKKTVYWKDAKSDAQELSLVLMDVEMPVMDGLTCSRRIRELQAEGSVLKHIPIIAVTANARQAQIDMMFEAGMDDVVSKPYRINELIPKLHSVVKKYKDYDSVMGIDSE